MASTSLYVLPSLNAPLKDSLVKGFRRTCLWAVGGGPRTWDGLRSKTRLGTSVSSPFLKGLDRDHPWRPPSLQPLYHPWTGGGKETNRRVATHGRSIPLGEARARRPATSTVRPRYESARGSSLTASSGLARVAAVESHVGTGPLGPPPLFAHLSTRPSSPWVEASPSANTASCVTTSALKRRLAEGTRTRTHSRSPHRTRDLPTP